MVTNFTALFDANVLYPFELRDLLVRMAREGLFRARWTTHIHDEWVGAVLKKNPGKEASLRSCCDAMDRSVLDCLVTDYEALIPSINLPDENDKHVLAAAIKGRCDVIVTFNQRHFPNDELKKYSIEIAHPDKFVTHNIDLSIGTVCKVLNEQRMSYTRRSLTADDLLDRLSTQGLKDSTAALREKIALI
jgi:hypothetical protein